MYTVQHVELPPAPWGSFNRSAALCETLSRCDARLVQVIRKQYMQAAGVVLLCDAAYGEAQTLEELLYELRSIAAVT